MSQQIFTKQARISPRIIVTGPRPDIRFETAMMIARAATLEENPRIITLDTTRGALNNNLHQVETIRVDAPYVTHTEQGLRSSFEAPLLHAANKNADAIIMHDFSEEKVGQGGWYDEFKKRQIEAQLDNPKGANSAWGDALTAHQHLRDIVMPHLTIPIIMCCSEASSHTRDDGTIVFFGTLIEQDERLISHSHLVVTGTENTIKITHAYAASIRDIELATNTHTEERLRRILGDGGLQTNSGATPAQLKALVARGETLENARLLSRNEATSLLKTPIVVAQSTKQPSNPETPLKTPPAQAKTPAKPANQNTTQNTKETTKIPQNLIG
jgi:hypothetical protein